MRLHLELRLKVCAFLLEGGRRLIACFLESMLLFVLSLYSGLLVLLELFVILGYVLLVLTLLFLILRLSLLVVMRCCCSLLLVLLQSLIIGLSLRLLRLLVLLLLLLVL